MNLNDEALFSGGNRSSGDADRLGIQPRKRVWVGGHDVRAKHRLREALAGCARPPVGEIDAAFVCALSAEEAEYFMKKAAERLGSGGLLWVMRSTAETESASSGSGVEMLRTVAAELGFDPGEWKEDVGGWRFFRARDVG